MEQEKRPRVRELSDDELRQVGGGDGHIDRDTLDTDLGDLVESTGLGTVLAPQ